MGAPGSADDAERLAGRIEDLDLMAVAAIADVQISLGIQGHMLRIFQPGGHENLGGGKFIRHTPCAA